MNINLRNHQAIEAIDINIDSLEDFENHPNNLIASVAGPNRFYTLTYFFSDSDGVRIQEDIDLSLVTVYYFNDQEEVEIDFGPLYDWSIKQYKEEN